MVPVADDICYLLSSMVIRVRVPESGVCVHISGEDCMLYVRVRCLVVRGCAVSRCNFEAILREKKQTFIIAYND